MVIDNMLDDFSTKEPVALYFEDTEIITEAHDNIIVMKIGKKKRQKIIAQWLTKT